MQRELHAVQRALACQGRALVARVLAVLAGAIAFSDRCCEQGIDSKPVMIVEIFVTQSHGEHALPEKLFETVLDPPRIRVERMA